MARRSVLLALLTPLAISGCHPVEPEWITPDQAPLEAGRFVGTWSIRSRTFGDHTVVLSRDGQYRGIASPTQVSEWPAQAFSGPWFMRDGSVMLHEQPIDPPLPPQPIFVPNEGGTRLVAQPPGDGTMTKIGEAPATIRRRTRDR